MALEWNSEVNDPERKFDSNSEDQRIIVPKGIYLFAVKAFKKAHSTGKDAPMCKLTLGIYAPHDAEFKTELTTCRDQLILHEDCSWKIAQFFTAIGDRKHGELFRPAWDQIGGATGKCELQVELYKDKPQNKVEKYLDPDPTDQKDNPDQPPPPAPATPAPQPAKKRIEF
jgi:hypothetical protein